MIILLTRSHLLETLLRFSYYSEIFPCTCCLDFCAQGHTNPHVPPPSRLVVVTQTQMWLVALSSTDFSGLDGLVLETVRSILHVFLRPGEMRVLGFQGVVEYSINRDRLRVQDVHVPIVASTKDGAADYVSQAGWDYALPDVEANSDAWCALPDALQL